MSSQAQKMEEKINKYRASGACDQKVLQSMQQLYQYANTVDYESLERARKIMDNL